MYPLLLQRETISDVLSSVGDGNYQAYLQLSIHERHVGLTGSPCVSVR